MCKYPSSLDAREPNADKSGEIAWISSQDWDAEDEEWQSSKPAGKPVPELSIAVIENASEACGVGAANLDHSPPDLIVENPVVVVDPFEAFDMTAKAAATVRIEVFKPEPLKKNASTRFQLSNDDGEDAIDGWGQDQPPPGHAHAPRSSRLAALRATREGLH